MNLHILSIIVTLMLLAGVCRAQKLEPPKLDPRPSTESQDRLIDEGTALHDRGDYDSAINRYQQVLRENPENVLALYELSFSYAAKKDCRKSLEFAFEAAKYRSKLLGAIYGEIGNCQDDLGKPKEAIETFKTAIQLLPSEGLLYYNLGLTYFRTGQLDDARMTLKQSASLNPAHANTHNLLSIVFDKGGYRTPALLAACRFLILEPTSKRSQIAFQLVQKLMQAGVSPAKDGKNISVLVDPAARKDEGDFGGIEMAMGLLTAGNYIDKNKGKSAMQLLADNFRTLFAILSESADKADRSHFAWNYYVPYFAELKKQGHSEAFAYFINQQSNNSAVPEWLTEHQDKVSSFLNWSKGYKWPRA